MNVSALRITPDQVARELVDFGSKFAIGSRNLLNTGPILTGVTPSDCVYSEDKLSLLHFKSPYGDPTNPVPVLIVYALVNRPYMTDLEEGRSLVQGLLKAGLDIYLIDWGYPDLSDKYLGLEDYIDGYMDRCVDQLRKRCGLDKINVLGICQGGSFSLCYSALHPAKVKNLITMVTPVDFQTPENLLSRWVRHVDIDLLIDTVGNVPGEMLNLTFLSLKPYRLAGQKYLDLINRTIDDPTRLESFLRMEKWIFDSPDQAGRAFREFIVGFYQKNGLIKGNIEIGDRKVDLKKLTMPVLNIYASEDHLVPPSASKALSQYVGTKDYQELEFRGGHIGIYVSHSSQKEVPPAIGNWLNKRT